MATIKLTPKEDKFAREYVKCSNATQAYRKAYNTKTKSDTVRITACKLLKKPNIALTIENIRKAAQKRCEVSVAIQTEKLQTFIDMAVDDREISAGITGVMSQAKLHGLLVDPGIPPAVVNNTQINISADHDLARKVAFMLAKAAQSQKQEQ